MMNEGVKEEHINGDKPVMPNGNMPQQQPVRQFLPPPQDTMYHTKVKENFNIYGLATFLFACVYAFCLYRNPSGIAYLFFVAAGIFYINFCVKKLGIEAKKGRGFYTVSMILLAISTFCTDDGFLIFFNKLGIFLLTISMLLWIFYNTGNWSLGKYLEGIFITCFFVIGEISTPFSNGIWYLKNKLDKKNMKFLYVLLGLLISIPFAATVLLLLTSADIVYKNIVDTVLSRFKFGNIFLIIWLIFSMFIFAYGILVVLCKQPLKEDVKDKSTGEPLIAIVVTTVLSLLYLVFSVVQILYLFIGKMQLPEGYTYAEYAREGFFQLLAVGILNLILVLVGICFFRPNKVLKAVLAVMSACTFIMLISSAMRMTIYIQYYYLTSFRILVLWCLAVLFLIFAGVMVYIFNGKFPLFRYSMVVVTVLYLMISFAHPDYWIAKVNLAGSTESRSEFFKGDAYDDDKLLGALSADAAPVLLEWEEGGYHEKYEERLEERTDDITIRKFNVSRFMAKRLLNEKKSGE